MAVGRITGQMLSSTLNRVTSDLTIRSTGEANLIQVDTSNQRVGIATASPTVPFEVTGAIKGSTTITATTSVTGGTATVAGGSITDTSGAISFGNENLTTTGQINTSGVRLLENEITTIRSNDDLILSANGSGGVQIEGSLTVSADLTVNGSTTTVNSTTLTVDDKNIELAHSPSGASPSDTLADGGGIILKGSTNHTILWTNATDDWDFSDTIDVASGKVYKVNGTEVLSGTTVTTTNAVHNVISSSDSSSVRINDGLLVDGALDVGSNFTISNTTAITAILDEDDMSSNSATALATQQSIKAYVDSEVTSGATLTVIDDSSSAVSLVLANDDLKIAGGNNITTSASGDSISVALDAALTGLTSVQIDSLNLQDNSITTDSNADLELSPGGTGIVKLNAIGSNDSSVINVRDGLDIDGTLSLNNGTTVNLILDEDDLSSDSNTALATQQSIKAYVDAQITAEDLDIAADDSTAIAIDLDSEVLQFSGGANITTKATGNTLTASLDAALTGLTSVQIDSLNLQDNSITSDSNADIEITPGGSGNTNFSKSDNQIILPQGNTAARNGNIEGSFRYNTETDKFEGYSASGWGAIGGGSLTAVDDSSSTITVELADNSVKFAGGNNITTSVSGTTVTSALDAALTGLTSVQIDSLNLQDNSITTDSNADLELSPGGTGIVKLNAIGSNDSSVINVRDGLDIDGTLSLNNGTTVNLILDEDDMSSNSATALATQQSIKAYVDSEVTSGGTLTVIDDSSSAVSVVIASDDLKIGGGANITTSASGDTLSVALDAALTGLTSVQIDSLNLSDNNITTDSNADLTLAPGGTGKINLTAGSDVQVPANIGVLFGTGGEKIESDGTDLTATITGNFVFSGTTAIDVPVGTTGQRPTVNTGLIRFNSTLGVYEGSTDGSTYVSFLTAPSGEAADINKDVFTTSNDSTTDFSLSFTPAEAQNVLVFVDNIFQESTNNYTVSGSTLTMTAALHNGARVVVLHGFDGSGGVSGATWIGGSNTDIDSAIENVDTFTTTTYRAAEYTYVATNAEGDGDSTSGHETGKILIVHDGSTAQMSQYGITHTGTAPVLTFSVDIDSGSVRLRAASIAANTGVRFARLGLAPL